LYTKYRPDIDGLRGLAVAAVLFFHAKVPLFDGGFVGVDVFFVVSGYLITSIIVSDLRAQTFSIARFYERRIRRIFPALFAVIAFTTIVTIVIYLPSDLEGYGRSVLASALFVSNFYFWRESGYFAAAAGTKPLLHTWSLAVEEQFYIVYPAFLLLIHRLLGDRWLYCLVFVLVLSFLTNIWAVGNAPVAAFYLGPARAWELLIGALLAMCPGPTTQHRLSSEIAALAGAGMLVWSVVALSEKSTFPGYNALVPCIGTGLIIHAGTNGTSAINRILSIRPLVLLGLISYSLYLWHWPLLVFVHYWNIHELSLAQSATVLLIALIISACSWRYVERPFRFGPLLPDRGGLFKMGAFVMCIAAAAGLLLHVANGLPGRLSDSTHQALNLDEVHDRRDCHFISDKGHPGLCIRGYTNDKVDFILVGDSHADALSPAIFETAKIHRLSGIQFTDYGFRPIKGFWNPATAARDRALVAWLETLIKERKPGFILVAASWNSALDAIYYEDYRKVKASHALSAGMRNFISQFPDTRVFILQTVPVSEIFGPTALARSRHLGKSLEQKMPRAKYALQTVRYEAVLAGLQIDYNNVQIVSVGDSFCDVHYCYGALGDGRALYRDADHVSPAGAEKLTPLFADIFSRASFPAPEQ